MGQLSRILVWLATPALIYLGLEYLRPSAVAALLALLLVLRHRKVANSFLAGVQRFEVGVLTALLALMLSTIVLNSEALLRLYPFAVNLGMAMVFGLTLARPPSMIERFARLQEPDLPEQGVQYTRQVTVVWVLFLISNGAIALYTALCASRDVWALYNGLIAYLLMGAMFAGEWWVRRWVRGRAQP
jgi:uncharacterized membrane protein